MSTTSQDRIKFSDSNGRKTHEKPWWCKDAVIYSFNFPRVAANLERLMGNTVVRISDRNYMQKLVHNIKEDFKNELRTRIEARQIDEVKRLLSIILNPRKDIKNFSRALFQAQSIVLMTDLEESYNADDVELEKIPKMIAEHPVFVINQKTNKVVLKHRKKLKTTKEKNAERLLRQGRRWEKERILMEENEKRRAELAKQEREKLLEKRSLYLLDVEGVGRDVLKIHNNKFIDCEKDLEQFLINEQIRMNNRGKGERRRLTIDEQINRMPSVSMTSQRTSEKSEKTVSEQIDEEKFSSDMAANGETTTVKVDEEESFEELRKKVLSKRFEDPRLVKFKQAETSNDLYKLAEEIFGTLEIHQL